MTARSKVSKKASVGGVFAPKIKVRFRDPFVNQYLTADQELDLAETEYREMFLPTAADRTRFWQEAH